MPSRPPHFSERSPLLLFSFSSAFRYSVNRAHLGRTRIFRAFAILFPQPSQGAPQFGEAGLDLVLTTTGDRKVRTAEELEAAIKEPMKMMAYIEVAS